MAVVTLLQKWQLLQAVFADPSLSATAKVVTGRILDFYNTQTGRCCPSYQTLADGTALKRRAIIYAVQELEAGGWIAIDRVKGGAAAGAGRYATNAIRIDFSRPNLPASTVHGDALLTVHGDALSHDDNSAPPDTGGVHGDAPSTVHGDAPESIKNTGKGNREVSPPTPSPFDEFWQAYPKQEGEDAARREYDRVIREQRATHDQIVEGATAYAAARQGEPTQYTAGPGRWLKDGRWRDRPAPAQEAPTQRRGSFSATRDWLPERMDVDE